MGAVGSVGAVGMMTGPRGIVVVVLLAAVLGAFAPSWGATDAGEDFEVVISNSIDIPTRTVTVGGDNFTVSAVARRYRGDRLRVDVTAPRSNATYDVNLYNSNSRIEAFEAKNGSGTATFDTTRVPAGLYYAGVHYDGTTVEIHPVVLAAYEVTLEVPGDGKSGSTASATVSVHGGTRERPPTFVQVVIGDERRERRVNASADSAGTYTAEFAVDLPAGEYVAYGVARGDNETDAGEKTLVGLSDGHTYRVSGPGGTPAGGTPTESEGRADTGTPPSNDSVITPVPPTPRRRTTPAPTPGFGPGLALVALLGLTVLAGVRPSDGQ